MNKDVETITFEAYQVISALLVDREDIPTHVAKKILDYFSKIPLENEEILPFTY